MQISDLLLTRPSIRWDDQLLLALNILGGKHTPYRVVVIDEKSRIKGVISGRRILEVLLGRRGEALRVKKGIKGILKEPVSLFWMKQEIFSLKILHLKQFCSIWPRTILDTFL
ncbi:hypothetical protein DRO51_00610 [Candidatus Bathyarchaeota archaeon]|nr:MAG: hypothetical protein DRO51_00610 [Candidatus Bathyarchaeota archaeon]